MLVKFLDGNSLRLCTATLLITVLPATAAFLSNESDQLVRGVTCIEKMKKITNRAICIFPDRKGDKTRRSVFRQGHPAERSKTACCTSHTVKIVIMLQMLNKETVSLRVAHNCSRESTQESNARYTVICSIC